MVSKGLISSVIPGWSEGPDLRCAIAHRGISRFRVRSLRSRPGMTTQEKAAPMRAALFEHRFCLNIDYRAPQQGGSGVCRLIRKFGVEDSKIRGDAFVFPIAVAGWFR